MSSSLASLQAFLPGHEVVAVAGTPTVYELKAVRTIIVPPELFTHLNITMQIATKSAQPRLAQ